MPDFSHDLNIFKRQQLQFYRVNALCAGDIVCDDCLSNNEDFKQFYDDRFKPEAIEDLDSIECFYCDNKPLNLITYREICVIHHHEAMEIIDALNRCHDNDDIDAYLNMLIDAYDIDNQGEIYTIDLDCDIRPWGSHDPSIEIGQYFISYNENIEVFSIHKLEI